MGNDLSAARKIYSRPFIAPGGPDCYDRFMLGFDTRIARYVWTIVLVLLLVESVYLIRRTLFIFTVALLLAYLLWPVVDYLDKRIPGRSKIPSLAIVYLALIAVLVAIGIEIGSKIVVQANAFGATIPKLLDKLETPIVTGVHPGIGLKIISGIQRQLAEHWRDLIMPISEAIISMMSHVEVVLFILLIPILSFFFLKDGRTMLSSLLDVIPKASNREMLKEIASDLHLLLAQYMRALVLLGLITSIAYAIFLSLIGLPFGLLLGTMAFFFEFVPMVGPLMSSTIILLVAGLSGFDHLLWIVIFLIVFRLFQDYVLSPQLLSSGMRLHPLVVIFGVLAGGQIAGIAGTFLSVPVLATLRIVFRQLTKQRGAIVPPDSA
jgi:predicted PurR-regulated permease PerM